MRRVGFLCIDNEFTGGKKNQSFILSSGQTSVVFHNVFESYFIMNYSIRHYLLSVLVLGGLSLTSPLMAQVGKVSLDNPSFDELPSPNFGGNTEEKNFRPKDWLEVEVKFKVEMPRSYKSDFVDRVTVKWYVAIEDPAGGRGTVYIEKEINHVNVPVDEDVYTSVYLSPSAVKRISGGENAGKRIVKSVGGEILVNGQAAVDESGFFSSTGKPGWWLKISRYDKIPLLSKNETPFKPLWWDRYAEIEERSR